MFNQKTETQLRDLNVVSQPKGSYFNSGLLDTTRWQDATQGQYKVGSQDECTRVRSKSKTASATVGWTDIVIATDPPSVVQLERYCCCQTHFNFLFSCALPEDKVTTELRSFRRHKHNWEIKCSFFFSACGTDTTLWP